VGTTRAECPRCHQVRQWPKGVTLKQFCCLACGYDVSLDPHSISAPLSQRLAAPPQERPVLQKKPRQSKATPRIAIAAIVAGTLLVFCLPIIAVVLAMRTDEALVEAVEAFTAAALAGQAEKAKEWVPADQEAAFQTWMLMNTTSRPLGQSGAFEVQVVEYSSTAARARVSFQRTVQDTHVQFQSWRRPPGGRWQFDAAATLQQGE